MSARFRHEREETAAAHVENHVMKTLSALFLGALAMLLFGACALLLGGAYALCERSVGFAQRAQDTAG